MDNHTEIRTIPTASDEVHDRLLLKAVPGESCLPDYVRFVEEGV